MKVKHINKKIFSVLEILILFIIIIGIVSLFVIKESSDVEKVTFYHWWRSSGEGAALNALVNVFLDKYPEIIVLPTTVINRDSGGGGVAIFNLVRPMVFSREAPDAFQIHAGYEGKIYFDAGLLEPVDDIWEAEELDQVTPEIIKVMSQFKGHYYSVPINIHRTNVVWYNKEILDKNNIDPSKLTTWDSFFEVCDKLKSGGIEYPIQMGTAWTAQHTFDQIVAGRGIEFYERWINGNVTSADDPELLESFEIFKKYLSYVNPDHADIEWNEATARVISGEGAFNIMGDWANGEFKSTGMEYNKDYGTFTVPETKEMYGIVIDAFQRPKYIKNPEASEKWLRVVASKEGQDAFNPLKGSISVRKDSNVAKYDLYQQTAIFDFVTLQYMFPAVSNAMPKTFEQKEQEVIAQFTEDLDINKAAKEITDYVKNTANDYTIIWDLS